MIVAFYRGLARLLLPRAVWAEIGRPLTEAFGDRWHERMSALERVALLLHETTSLLTTAAVERASRRQPRRGSVWRLRDDVVMALRKARRAPTFTATVAVTLVLGLGSLAGALHLVQTVLLEPLPFNEPQDLVRVFEHNITEGVTDGRLATADFIDYRVRNETLVGMAAYSHSALTMPLENGGVLLQTELVTPGYFELLGVPPAVGSWFLDEHHDADRAYVILSHSLWQTVFGADTSLVGRMIPLGDDRGPRQVVGIMPPTFRGMGEAPDVWLPWGRIEDNGSPLLRRMHPLRVVARRRSDVSIDGVELDLLRIAHRLEAEYPQENEGHLVRVSSLHTTITAPVAAGLWSILGAVMLVMLAATANLAHLFVTRGIERSRELAIRRALGASRMRLAIQLGIEAAVVAIPAAVMSLTLGRMLVVSVVERGAQIIPRPVNVALSPITVGVVALVGLLVTVFLAVVQARQGHRRDNLALRASGPTTHSRSHTNLRSGLACAQVAVAIIVLVGAARVSRSYLAVTNVDPGFDSKDVVAAEIVVPMSKYPGSAATRRLVTQLRASVADLPGMATVGITSQLPTSPAGGVAVYGPDIANEQRQTQVMNVDARSFQVLRIPLLAGRLFEPGDSPDSPRVVVVNETFARQFFPARSPLGATVKWGDPDAAPLRVIGVVGDVKRDGPTAPSPPILYMNADQWPWLSFFLIGRTQFEARSQLTSLRSAIQRVDQALVPWQLTTLEQALGENFARHRMTMIVLTVLAAVTLTVSVVGVYGVFAYQVTERRREIGLRIALGATTAHVRLGVVREALWVGAVGIVVGLTTAFWIAGWVSARLPAVPSLDIWSFGVSPLALLLLTVLAAWIPAHRSSAADPAIVLRTD